MEYDKENLILDFARRTRKNLELIEDFVEKSGIKTDVEAYEITQLVNSLLGLLVFPQETFRENIPAIPLQKLVENGWPSIQIIQGSLECSNLKQLMKYLRNGVAHHNVEFLSKDGETISGVAFWNCPPGSKSPNWKVKLTIADLKTIVFKFIELLESGAVPLKVG